MLTLSKKFPFLYLIAMFVALGSVTIQALPVLPFSEDGGLERLSRSKHKADFFKLANQFRIQTDRIVCGPTTGAIVMNALRYNTEKAPLIDIPQNFLDQMPVSDGKKYDPRLHGYTPETFMNAAALKIKTWSRIYAQEIDGKRDPGIQLDELRRIFEEAHHVRAIKINVGTKATASTKEARGKLPKSELNSVVDKMKKNLAEKDNYVVVNYSRAELKQAGSGHISPVGAYDEQTNSFLILDVNPFGGPWAWVDAEDLVNAMNTFDVKENRGLLLISDR